MDIDKILHQEELKLAAKDYLKQNVSIIPVGADKVPLISWREFCDRRATEAEVDEWFKKYPEMQLGAVCGQISGFTVIDVEAEGGEAEWNKLPQECPIAKTGSGGRHYYFIYEPSVKNAVRIDGQVKFSDIRNNGGYVVLPPSISNKGSYTWLKKVPLCRFPKELFKAKDASTGYIASQIQNKALGMKLLAGLYLGENQGGRNDAMVKYIGYILTQIHPDDWEEKAWPLAIEANNKNTPPLSLRELRNSYDSIRQAEKEKNPSRWNEAEAETRVKATDKLPVKKDYKNRYTWGTRALDTSMAIIKRGNFIVLGAKSSSGKTTFAFDMAQKNALLGHKVLFLSLEMDEKEVKDAVARRSAGITIEEEYDYTIPENKQKYFDKKLAEIESIKNLFFKGVRRGGGLKWEEILEIIFSYDDLDLIFIDNLDLIEGNKGENDLERQKRIVKKIMGFTSEKQIPIILIHHYRKTMAKNAGDVSSLDDLSGSMKIVDGADRILNITRNRNPEAPYPEKFRSRIYLQKGREYADCIRDVFFIHGTFVDVPPSAGEYDPLSGKSPIEYLEENKIAEEKRLEEELEKQHREQEALSRMFGEKD